MVEGSTVVSAADWIKGISLSILASIIGGASKLAIRKSWLIQQEQEERSLNDEEIIMCGCRNINCFGLIEERASLYTNTESHHCSPSSPHTGSFASAAPNGIVVAETGISMNNPAQERLEPFQLQLQDEEDHLTFSSSDASSYCSINGLLPTPAGTPASSTDPPRQAAVQFRRNPPRYLTFILRGSGMIGMTFLNPLCCVLAMKYASPSILAPFSGLTLVWIVLFSNRLIGEAPTVTQMLSCFLIVLGEVVVAVFGDHYNEAVSVEEVIQAYREFAVLCFFVCMVLWMWALYHWISSPSTPPKLQRFSWGVAGGSITGLQNFLKDSLTLIKADASLASSNRPYFVSVLPLFILLAAATAFGGLLLLTACMKRYDATYSSAMFVGSFVVSATIMSAIHYHTFQHLQNVVNILMYPVGLLLLMIGVLLLVQDSDNKTAEKSVDDVGSYARHQTPHRSLTEAHNDVTRESPLALI